MSAGKTEYRIQFIGFDYNRVRRTLYYKTRKGFERSWSKFVEKLGVECLYIHGWKRTIQTSPATGVSYNAWLFVRLFDSELGEKVLWDV